MIEMIRQFAWEWGINFFFPFFAVIGAFGIAMVLLSIVYGIYSKIQYLIHYRKKNWYKEEMLNELDYIKRWCGHDFPELEDICDRLRQILHEEKNISDISDWRQEMRKKYDRAEYERKANED